MARGIAARGITAFVLKYRLIPTPTSDQDFLQLVPHVVLRSAFPLDKAKQGAVAEQRRAHVPLAVMDGKQALRVIRERAATWGIDSQRIGILGFSAGGIIAVCTAIEPHAKDEHPAFVASIYSPFWLDLAVPSDAPPLFLALTNDDPNIADGNVPLYSAWKAAGRSVEVHSYAKGGHGFGMRKQGLPSDQWIERMSEWLQGENIGCPPSITDAQRCHIGATLCHVGANARRTSEPTDHESGDQMAGLDTKKKSIGATEHNEEILEASDANRLLVI